MQHPQQPSQQRPVRTSRPPVARTAVPRLARATVARTALAACATVVALPLAGRIGAGRAGRTAQVSDGSIASLLAPALPRRGRPGGTPRGAGRAATGVPTGASTSVATSVVTSAAPGEPPAPMTPRERLALGAAGTYIGEVLRVRDSAVVRWPERVERPLTVWVGNAAGLPDWRPAYLARVTDAFGEWTRTGVPVRFRVVQDSGAAEVHVAWTDRFREPISGRTVWSRDAKWWITDANITLALHHSDGSPLDEDQVRAIALHEVGHLLGLDHTSDPTNIMAARVRVRDLSSADQATARLVYTLPAGHL